MSTTPPSKNRALGSQNVHPLIKLSKDGSEPKDHGKRENPEVGVLYFIYIKNQAKVICVLAVSMVGTLGEKGVYQLLLWHNNPPST